MGKSFKQLGVPQPAFVAETPRVLRVIDPEDGISIVLQLRNRRKSQVLTPDQARALAKELVGMADLLDVMEVHNK